MNLEKTIAYYNKDLEVCDCMYCQTYIQKVKDQYKQLTTYLQTYGIDVCKPFETMLGEEDETSFELLEVQYVVIGKIHTDFHKSFGKVHIRVTNNHPAVDLDDVFTVISVGPIMIEK